jgi:class 3 adenylate cyclase/CheY-like chemotaxis protein
MNSTDNQPAATCAAEPAEIAPPAPAADRASAASILCKLRTEPAARLRCIDQICQEILGDELCLHLAESDGREDNDFLALLRETREVCEKGLDFLRRTFSRNRRLDAPDGMAQIGKDVHDFKNAVAGITYRRQFLSDQGDERFLPFAEELAEIGRQFDRCMSALDEARGMPSRQPAAAVPAAEAPPRPAPAASAADACMLNRFDAGHILVVDDDEETRNYLARELGRCGHEVTAVGEIDAALKILEEHCYQDHKRDIDLVLLDLWLNGRNGCEVLEELNKDYGLRSIPVVMVSASSDIDSVIQCISSGADDYLTKPFDPRLLQARVGSCLAKRKSDKRERVLMEEIQVAKRRADNLLYSIFPYTVAEELITSGAVKPRGCDRVAVMFCDVVGFTSYSAGRKPAEVVARLDELYTAYEAPIAGHKVEMIKTIGDCIMLTSGLLQRVEDPVMECLRCGSEMIQAARSCSSQWQVRIGLHVGPVVAGMAGTRHFAFDIWGDTVNTASRVEQTAAPSTISVSEPAWAQVFAQCKGRSLGIKKLKGKEAMEVFCFEGFREAAAQPVIGGL